MRGMGWKEGMSVGKNAPKEVREEAPCCPALRTAIPPKSSIDAQPRQALKMSACCLCITGNVRVTGHVCCRRSKQRNMLPGLQCWDWVQSHQRSCSGLPSSTSDRWETCFQKGCLLRCEECIDAAMLNDMLL